MQIEYNGKTQSLADWARELNINYQTLRSRILFGRMTLEEAFTKPITNNDPRLITHNGKTMPIHAWAKELKISYPALIQRMKVMSFEEAIVHVPYSKPRNMTSGLQQIKPQYNPINKEPYEHKPNKNNHIGLRVVPYS